MLAQVCRIRPATMQYDKKQENGSLEEEEMLTNRVCGSYLAGRMNGTVPCLAKSFHYVS